MRSISLRTLLPGGHGEALYVREGAIKRGRKIDYILLKWGRLDKIGNSGIRDSKGVMLTTDPRGIKDGRGHWSSVNKL
jgi:hypothetical protein